MKTFGLPVAAPLGGDGARVACGTVIKASGKKKPMAGGHGA